MTLDQLQAVHDVANSLLNAGRKNSKAEKEQFNANMKIMAEHIAEVASKKKELALKFLQYILSPEGQARLATSACYWAMPANSKAALNKEEKKILRWDEQPQFIPKSYHYLQPDEALDKAMLDVWAEFLQH